MEKPGEQQREESLAVSEADLERRGSNTNSNNGQWVGWEEGKTELTIFPR